MLTLIASLLALQPMEGDLTLDASGRGAWTLSCEAETENGVRSESARGRGSRLDSLRFASVGPVTCAYAVPEGGELFVTVTRGAGFICAFDPEVDIDDCRIGIAGGQDGEFRFDPAN